MVLLLAVLAVRRTPTLNWVAFLIGPPVVALTILEVVMSNNASVSLGSNRPAGVDT